MNGHDLLTIVGSIVTVALVTTIAVNGTGFAKVIGAGGSAFQGSLLAAQGK